MPYKIIPHRPKTDWTWLWVMLGFLAGVAATVLAAWWYRVRRATGIIIRKHDDQRA